LFICGRINEIGLTLWTGNLHRVVVPLSFFTPSGDGTKPDFREFSIIDYGHGVKFGDYEASSKAILLAFLENLE